MWLQISRTHRGLMHVLLFCCWVMSYQKLSIFKKSPKICYLSFCRSEVQAWLAEPSASGAHQTAIELSARNMVSSEACLGKNFLPDFLRMLAKFRYSWLQDWSFNILLEATFSPWKLAPVFYYVVFSIIATSSWLLISTRPVKGSLPSLPAT